MPHCHIVIFKIWKPFVHCTANLDVKVQWPAAIAGMPLKHRRWWGGDCCPVNQLGRKKRSRGCHGSAGMLAAALTEEEKRYKACVWQLGLQACSLLTRVAGVSLLGHALLQLGLYACSLLTLRNAESITGIWAPVISQLLDFWKFKNLILLWFEKLWF
jgi:hypothetical protein